MQLPDNPKVSAAPLRWRIGGDFLRTRRTSLGYSLSTVASLVAVTRIHLHELEAGLRSPLSAAGIVLLRCGYQLDTEGTRLIALLYKQNIKHLLGEHARATYAPSKHQLEMLMEHLRSSTIFTTEDVRRFSLEISHLYIASSQDALLDAVGIHNENTCF